MRVKRLELQGFKSFKDKTVVHFDEGITGIVGPNGCGKSNIVDSFFWVMGEQSVKHMRADGQIDLIFNGSEKFSPLSMAEVTLVLSTGADPSNLPEGASIRDLPPHLRYEEIAITRRLYRDGTSEYQINGQTCRLKDIHELFMDTGAGPKAYSIIEQGQISRIVASKPEDRRVMIEEAAGIVKFKARKKESLRKIESTQLNIARLNDIVTEIERHLGTLERQATKARQYKKYKEELQGKELIVSRKKLFGLKQKTKELADELQTLQITEVENKNALQTVELRIENYKIQLAEAQKHAEDAQNTYHALQQEISQNNTKIQLHKRHISELENSNFTLEEENDELVSKIDSLINEQRELTDERTQLENLFTNADEILKEHETRQLEAKAKADELAKALEDEKRALMASLSRQNEISNQVHSLEAKVDALTLQISNLSIKVQDRQRDQKIYSEKFSTSKELFESSSQKASSLRNHTSELKDLTQGLESELKQLRSDDSQTREEKAKIDSTLKTLQELVNNHEGFRADVRNILKNEEYSKNLKGVFADKIEAHPGYEYALEAVLREFLENLFVESNDLAKNLITSLKDQSAGRATFWSEELVEVLGNDRQTSAWSVPVGTTVKPLSDVIQITHPKSKTLLNLLKEFYVVDSLDEALDLFAEASPFGVTFVSKEGDILDRFGRISGGSVGSLEGGILARKAELQRLSEESKEITVRSEELTRKLKDVEETLSTKKLELERSLTELRDEELKAKTAERDLASAESHLKSVNQDVETMSAELQTLESQRSEYWQRLDEIRTELSSMEGINRDQESSIEEKSRAYNAANGVAAELQGQLVQLKVDFAAAQEKFRHAKLNLERIDIDLKQARVRKEEVESLINRKLDEKDFLAQELEVFEQAQSDHLQRAQDLQGELQSKKNEYETINFRLTDAFREQKESMKALEEATAKLSKLSLDLEKSQLEYQMLYQGLYERYGIEESAIAPVDDAEAKVFDELTPEKEQEMQQDVDWLKEKIRKLGEVNLMAVEEYDEQKKRHDFLISQREDLLKSIADLEKAIARINKTSEERFRVAFHEVNERFQRVFPIMFGGGSGKLEMTNPLDLNETGVEIIVEPPGKKMSSIQLLSGGEKALTAVALIFSIFLIKPSPFCVLDEVDAPLDDHNVGKFNALLKEMARRSQFIVITHNKRTMELNDKLYGVTMEDPGVSKMVSIDLH